MIVKFPLGILSWLILSSTGLCYQRCYDKEFVISDALRGYCPSLETASLTLSLKSVTECALKCFGASSCFAFIFYSSNATCYIYGSVPQTFYYNINCTLRMDREVDICNSAMGLPVHMEAVSDFEESSYVLLPVVNNWIIIMNRFDGSLDFDRTWSEYKNGFGDIGRGEFWLGNEIVHRLTNRVGATYVLRVEVQLNATGQCFYAEYATFSLDSESNKYTLHLSGYSGNAGDGLIYHDGCGFSTIDADNDKYVGNCASDDEGGWWFDACFMSCLTCPYGGYFVWYSDGGWQTSGLLRKARLMIKSI